MATGLTLSRVNEEQYHTPPALRGYNRHINLRKDVYFKANEMTEGAPQNNARSPWIRLFKLFQSKSRADEAQQRVSSSNNSSMRSRSKDSGRSHSVDAGSKTPSRKNSKEEEAKVKRNIYRRPSSRAIFNPRLSRGMTTDTYSMQKCSRRKSDPVEDNCGTVELIDPEDEEMVEPVSRQKRPRSRSVPAICQGTGFRKRLEQGKRDSMASSKQTYFKEDVSVVYYEEERKGSLSREPRDIKNCVNVERRVKLNDKVDLDESSNSSFTDVDNEKPSCSSSSSESQAIVIVPGGTQSIDVPPTFTVGKNRRGIRLMIELDDKCLRNRTSVKAMSGGQTLIVMTYKSVPHSETEVNEFSDRINLPVAIDPFSVKANVLRSGHLCIEAPLRKFSV